MSDKQVVWLATLLGEYEDVLLGVYSSPEAAKERCQIAADDKLVWGAYRAREFHEDSAEYMVKSEVVRDVAGDDW